MNIIGILLGIFLSLGGISTYIPQFHKIVKNESVEGISEPCLLLMNLAMMCLTMNSVIFNWDYFFSFDIVNLLPFITIFISWLMVLIYYIIFITYKIKNLENRLTSGMQYIFTYLIFSLLMVALALGEEMKKNKHFFIVYANILGVSSSILNALVYIPQIYTLLKEKNNGNLSLLMYALQTPGNIVIILFQAVIYKQAVSTWITYVVVLVQQSIILALMTYYHCRFNETIESDEILVDETIPEEFFSLLDKKQQNLV